MKTESGPTGSQGGKRRSLAAAASLNVLGAVLCLAAPGVAQAQEDTSNAQSDRATSDIVVTATKVATNVQDVPIAITAVTAETLETRALTTTADLGNIVPNAAFRKAEGVYGPAVTVYLRGIGQLDPQFSGEPAVAFYIDDIYYPFLFGSQFDLLDLDHVEVLRGPQGTLFGRNAIAGAVNLVSKKPSLTEASAFIDVTVGAYDRRDLRTGFSVPLTDTLALGASFISKKRNGYQDMVDFSCQMHMNGTPELAGTFPFQTPHTTFGGGREPESCVFDHLGGEDTRAVRGSLYWEPTPDVQLSISADYLDQNDEIPAEHVFEFNYLQTMGLRPDGTVDESAAEQNFITSFDQFSIPGTPFRWDDRFETGDPFKTYDNFCDPFPAGYVIEGNSYYNGSIFKGGKCYGNNVTLDNKGIQGKLVIGLTDAIDFTAIAGYREMFMEFGAASDGTPLQDSLIYHSYDESHWTGELRLTGQHGWLDWVAGVFYYDGEAEHLGQPQDVEGGTQRYQVDRYIPTAKAGYANVVVRPTDRLSVTGGIRYSDDEKFVDFNSLTDATPPGEQEFVPSPASTIFTTQIGTKRWDWKAGLDYLVTEDVMVYASAGSGYRLPGFNVRPAQFGQEGQIPGEALISYEVGAKAEFFDRRLRLNVAAFQMDFTERPVGFTGQEGQYSDDLSSLVEGEETVISGGPEGTDFANAFTTCRPYDAATDGPKNFASTNDPTQGIGVNCIPRSFYYGVAEGRVRGFEAELEAEPVDRLLINGGVGYSSFTSEGTTRQTNVPKWTASGGIQYEIPAEMLGGSITPRLDWFFNSTIYYSANFPQYRQDSRSTFNARLTYRNEDHDFDIALGATNLFNTFYYRNIFARCTFGGSGCLGQPAPPREWYLSLEKRF